MTSDIHAPCPDPETIAAFAAGGLSPAACEGISSHVADCGDCRGIVGALQRTRPLAALPPQRLFHRWLAAAASLLVALSAGWALWGWDSSGPPVPATPAARMQDPLRVSEELSAPRSAWLDAGSRLILRRGALTRLEDAGGGPRLSLVSGDLEIQHRVDSPLALQTPAGTLEGLGPCALRIRCGTPPETAWSWLLPSAEASSIPDLVVDLLEGKARLLPAEHPEDALVLLAGERLTLTAGSPPRREPLPPTSTGGLQIWRGDALAALLGGSARIEGGPDGSAKSLPLPAGDAFVVEVIARPLTPASRMGLVVPTGGLLRLWQISGSDCPPGAVHRLLLAVLGRRASGSVDGRNLWSVQDTLVGLQKTDGPPGLRVWGSVEIQEIRVRTFEAAE
jgi:hypothetical protein